MDKSLLKYDIVVEVDPNGAFTVYYSRDKEDAVSSILSGIAKEAGGPVRAKFARPYCHFCFDFECDTDEQLRAHEGTCKSSGGQRARERSPALTFE
jgi:hypothetical protein